MDPYVFLSFRQIHVVVPVDDLRADMGDYVDGVLLRQALRGERDLEVDILQRDGG